MNLFDFLNGFDTLVDVNLVNLSAPPGEDQVFSGDVSEIPLRVFRWYRIATRDEMNRYDVDGHYVSTKKNVNGIELPILTLLLVEK